MDYVLFNEFVDGMIVVGGKKLMVSVKNLLICGFYFGVIFGFVVILVFIVGIIVKVFFVGLLLFFFGFVSIVLFGMELVIGNFVLLLMVIWVGKSIWGVMFCNWVWVWIGNWIGIVVVVVIMVISFISGIMDGVVDNIGLLIWDVVV